MCSDWDADLEDQKNKDRKTPQTSPCVSSVDTFTHKPSRFSIEQLHNQCSASPETEMEVQIFDTLATLLGHEKTETLEDINKRCRKQCLLNN